MDNKKDLIKGWLLILATVVFIVGYFLYTFIYLKDAPSEDWDFGTTQFVPSSSNHAIEKFDIKQPPLQIVKKDSIRK